MPVPVAILTAAALAFAGCGEDDDASDGTFQSDAFPLTFSYPDGFEETTDVTLDTQVGLPPDSTAAVALDADNSILLQRFTLPDEVTDRNFDKPKAAIEGLVRQIDPDAPAPAESEIAGLRALTVDEVALDVPADGVSRLIVLFDGDQEYLINCQSTPESRDELDAACDQAIETLAVE